MRILIDILHPAHVHFFRNAIRIWQSRGHEILVTSRKKDIALELLDLYRIEHTHISDYGRGIWGLGKELVSRDIKLWRLARQFRPQVMAGIAGVSIAAVGRMMGVPSIVFTDTEHARLSNYISFPFASLICTPRSFTQNIGPRQLRYNGLHQLAYLHPKLFTPRPEILEQSGLSPQEKYIIVRLVSWQAAHDVGEGGIKSGVDFVRELEKLGRVIITSEEALPPELEKNRIRVSPDKIHHLIAYAHMYVGESPTMASESGILGTPAILISSWAHRAGCIMEESRYGLIHAFPEQAAALEKAKELWRQPDVKQQWQSRSRAMLNDMIEVTPWLVDLVENYAL